MRYTTGQAVIKSLEIEGVEQVFGLIGSTTLDLFDLVGRSKSLNFVGSRHEEHSAHMAHGYSRACGKLALILSQNGAGVTNEVTGLVTALKSHVPILAIGGAAPSSHADSDHRHEVDQVAVMRPVTKWAARIPRGDRAPEFMQRAFRTAMTHPRGPVFLEIPTDVLAESFEWEPPKSRNAYRAAFEGMINSEAVEAAAKLISSAERPAFIVGAGGEDDQMWEDLAAISDKHQIMLSSSFGHNSAIPRSSFSVGSIGRGGSRAAMQLLSEADLVAVIGSRLSRYTTVPYYGFEYWPKSAQVIHVEADWTQIGRQRSVDLGIAGDCKEFIARLKKALPEMVAPGRARWQSRIESLKAGWNEERALRTVPAVHNDTGYFEPAAVYARLGETLRKDTIFVNEVGANPASAFSMIDYGSPKGLMYTGTMAGLGFAMPGAIGAKVGQPGRPVVAMIGDGAFSLSLPALISAVEYHVPVQILVFDNACWGAEKSHQQQWFDSYYVGSDLKTADLVGIAKAIGADACRVKNLDELSSAMKDAPITGPRVIVVPTDPNRFPKVVPNIGAPAKSFKG